MNPADLERFGAQLSKLRLLLPQLRWSDANRTQILSYFASLPRSTLSKPSRVVFGLVFFSRSKTSSTFTLTVDGSFERLRRSGAVEASSEGMERSAGRNCSQ